MVSGAGRYAPSPSGPLHLGNLRTAMLAWLSSRARDAPFVLRIDDLDRDRSRPEHQAGQLADLAALGIDFDGQPLRQQHRLGAYEGALAELQSQGLVYPCWCTRAEIQAAASAPHAPAEPHGPGTCRERPGRPAALRVRAEGAAIDFVDRHHGPQRAAVDDIVVRRGDGTFAYHLATVVDDDHQGVGEVVRGEDLLSSTASQIWLIDRLGLTQPAYAHVPLVLNRHGQRLAKRDGAVTLSGRLALGEPVEQVVGTLAASVGLGDFGQHMTMTGVLERYDAETFSPGVSGPLPGLS